MIGKYECVPLTSDKRYLGKIQEFIIDREKNVSSIPDKVIGLESYLKRCAWIDDLNNEVKIYLIIDVNTDDIAAYFGLKAGMVVNNETGIPSDEDKIEVLKEFNAKLVSSVTPGIEISHFAVNDEYRRKIKTGEIIIRGLGQYFYPAFIYPIIEEVSEKIGVKMIYLYAAGDDHLINYYEKVFGFRVANWDDYYMPLQPEYDGNCRFMYQLRK